MENTAEITKISSRDLIIVPGTSATIRYTQYQGWSGKSYGSGRVSGVRAVPATMEIVFGKSTDKAIELKQGVKTCWVPKSKLSLINDKYVVTRGFCYIANWPKWNTPRTTPNQYSFQRTTVI